MCKGYAKVCVSTCQCSHYNEIPEQGISAVKQCLPIWKPKKVLWNKLKESPIQRGSPNAF